MFTTQKLSASLCAHTRKLFLSFFFFNLIAFSLAAQSFWIGGTGNWSNPANWDTGTVPGSSDEVYIDNGGTVNYDVPGGGAVASLQIGSGTLTGNEYLTVVNEFHWQGGTISGSGILEITGSLYIEESGGKFLEGKNLLVTGDIFWYEGNFNINSTGKLQVNAGTMEIDLVENAFIGGSPGAAIELYNGAGLTKKSSTFATFNCSFQVDGATVSMEDGTIDFGINSSSNLSSCNLTTFAGTALNFNAGSHIFGPFTGASGGGTINVSGASLNLNGGNVLNLPVNLSDGEIGGTSAGILTQTVNWSGGSFTPFGAIIVFSSINVTNPVAKNISNGTLQINGIMDWTDGDIIVENGATLLGNGGSSINLSHASDQTLGGEGTINIEGDFVKSQGSVTEIEGSFTYNGGSFLLNNGTLRMMPGSTGLFSENIQVSFAATFEMNGGNHTVEGSSAFSGNGNLLISGGSTTFSAGSQLTISLEITGGTLQNSADLEPKNYTQSGGVFTGNGNTTVSGYLNWDSGTISGSGTINVNGTTTWENGSRTLDTKTLMLNGNSFWNGGDFIFANNGKIESAIARTMTIDHNSTVSATGAGMLEIDGEVKLMNSSATTNLGIQFVLNGIMTGNGTFANVMVLNQGVISPGVASIGQISLHQFDNSTGTLEIELGGTGTGGVDFDQLVITSSGNFQSTVNVSLANGFNPSVGDEFQIVDCASCSGKFLNENMPALSCSNCEWQIIYGGNGVTLKVAALLPVELIDFQVSEKNRAAELYWSTASEVDNRGFQVEKSLDGLHWEKIGFVAGHGSSFTTHHYRFEHPLVKNGTHYFRLRQLDFDGTESLSAIKSLRFDATVFQGTVSVAPNPNDGINFHLIFTETAHIDVLTITDQSGKTVWIGNDLPVFEGRLTLPVRLSAGLYLLHTSTGTGVDVHRFMVK